MKILKHFKNIRAFILDILFPIHCLSCQKEGSFICEECFQKVELLSFQLCPKCERYIIDGGKLCQSCKRSSPPLDALVVASRYRENNISKLVHLLKYNFAEDLHIPLGRLLVKIILKNNLPLPDFIVPIPLHKRRLRWRGFNQAELLAKYVAENLTPGFPIPVFSDLILRRKYTPPQMKIKKYSERRKNIEDAFMFNTKSKDFTQLQQLEHSNKYNFLLIDDIATTGATLFECAKVLKVCGAKKVFAAVIARQEFKR